MNAFSLKNFQQAFFEELELQFPKRGQMVNAISEVLNVGRDAVYRRLRGDTVLSANELMILSRKYGVSLDEGTSEKPKSKQLTFAATNWEEKSELGYYEKLEAWSHEIKELPGVTLDYVTSELPPHYEMGKPTLFAFKVYTYAHTAWSHNKWKGQEFRPELLDPRAFSIAERINECLFSLPGREMWSVGILNVTLRQIEHAVEVGAVRNVQLIDKLFTEIEEIVLHMEAMMKSGKRFAPGKQYSDDSPQLQVYNNELMDNSNAILVSSRDFSVAYTTLINPNFLVSKDPVVIRQVERWIGNLTAGANVLHAQPGNYASKFFLRLRRSIAVSRQKVDAMMLVH